MKRRHFLCSSASGGLFSSALPVLADDSPPVSLSSAHRDAVRLRKRRIVRQHDVYHVMRSYAKMHPNGKAPFGPFRDAVFSYIDEPGSQIDAVWWDIGGNTVGPVYPSRVLPQVVHPLLQSWLRDDVDWVRELVSETRRRKLEVFWSHRISEVDGLPEGGHEKERMHPLKAAHPDWTVPCSFWWQGMWNLASAGMREHKVAELRELAENYDLDGIQIDFARHAPYLPAGRQWELREHITRFMRMLRLMTLEVGKKRDRPFLLAARIPRNLAGCRMDGLDVTAWAEQELVDVLTLGTRSMDVEVEGFREATGGAVQLQPCFDDHHATDGYRYRPIEYLRGVFANHWQRGADSVVTFNWSIGRPEVARTVGGEIGSLAQQIAYREIGDPLTLVGKDKIFAVERRGGYPWSDGYINRNDDAPLPLPLDGGGRFAEVPIRISEGPDPDRASLVIRCVLFGAKEGDQFEVRLNGVRLNIAVSDPEWKDAQIFSPGPQPTSGGKGQYRIDPKQRLLRIDSSKLTSGWRAGPNRVEIRLTPPSSRKADRVVQLEKVEGMLRFA